MSEPCPSASPDLDYEGCAAVVKKCITRTVEQLLHKDLGFSWERSRKVAVSILYKKLPAKQLISSATNGSDDLDKKAIKAIEDMANRFWTLEDSTDEAFLLVSLPGKEKVLFDGMTEEMDQETMRRSQFKVFARVHPNINGSDLEELGNNTALVEVYSDVELYSVLDKFFHILSCVSTVKYLNVIFNGHGTPRGELVLRDGRNTHMNTITSAVQSFRKACHPTARNQKVHLTFAQCYSFKLDRTDALDFDLVNTVTWLTSDEDGCRKTFNSVTPDRQLQHDGLMQLLKGHGTIYDMDLTRKDVEATIQNTKGTLVEETGEEIRALKEKLSKFCEAHAEKVKWRRIGLELYLIGKELEQRLPDFFTEMVVVQRAWYMDPYTAYFLIVGFVTAGVEAVHVLR